ncbi:hypothetical protein MKW94_021496 [Papaver nudicaule]|uniref:Uncharacterized protein n=1 Tax=Papaver nudicaule TaxID=74823 RepID=A0AA41V0D7_PAPNU|nr:hypothetical protein [Papaver nudicaule]
MEEHSTDVEENSTSDMEEHSTDVEENSPPDMEENSPPMEMIDALLDIPPRELESGDALIDMPLQGLERSGQDIHIDIPLQELESPVQIFKIPNNVKKRNQDAYQPKMVSIGPYHYGKPQLQPMQSHKNRAVIQFLNRSPTGATEEQYIAALMLVYDDLWRSYEQVSQLRNWTPDGFIKLMMVDGIFLLEFLNVLHSTGNGDEYADPDPIFGKRGHILNRSHVLEDLLLLENQVPYLALFTLLTVSEGLPEQETETKLAKLMLAPTGIKGHHLLDMYIRGTLEGRKCQEPFTGEGATKVSAAELTTTYRMKFKPVATYTDIKFSTRSKTLKLPTILIDKGTIGRFYNMKAYQLVGDTGKELISYIHLLNFFILSAVDVNILRSQGIIVSSLDSDEAIIKVMKELTRDTVMVDNIDQKVVGIIEEVVKYYEAKTRVFNFSEWIAKRWRWIVGLLATVLYIINIVEATYSIGYYRNN